MGLFDLLKQALSHFKHVQAQEKKNKGTAIEIEEVPLDKPLPKKQKPARKPKPTPSLKDERKIFMEVVNILRSEAGLPPVEEKKEERAVTAVAPTEEERASPAKPEPVSIKKPTPAPPAPPSKREAQGSRPRSPSRAEIEKIVKVALKKLERQLYDMLDEDLRAAGIKSFKEKAFARRALRDTLKNEKELISSQIIAALQTGRDPREDAFLSALAEKLYTRVRETVFGHRGEGSAKPVEKKDEKRQEETAEDDVLKLLGGEKKEEKTTEGVDEELLKLLES